MGEDAGCAWFIRLVGQGLQRFQVLCALLSWGSGNAKKLGQCMTTLALQISSGVCMVKGKGCLCSSG